ncbi:MAG: HEPN domain-containing protein [Bacteroidia bacterium]|nr:HEPN domain-containing protein [Bacteroidia bacterium]
MKTETEIICLSDKKLEAAEVLLKNDLVDDAYYLAGYSLELLLKAKICKSLLIPDFFDFENS